MDEQLSTTTTGFTTETTMWTAAEAGQTITSTSLHPDFLEQIQKGNIFLDVGCCSGRITQEFIDKGAQLVGIDPNLNELRLGTQNNPDTHYTQAFGERLPFADNSFDGAVMLATLGAVGKEQRSAILKETVRCIKPGGIVYVAEFARIIDPNTLTSDGKNWQHVYQVDALATGEEGSVRVLRQDGSVRYICHHFNQDELEGAFSINGLAVKACKNVMTRSTVSGNLRPNWNIWGTKKT